MESSPERVCPSCSAPAEENQRWCLECGAELPRKRRSGLRPVVGIATTLTVLVGAASAAGYTLLQDGTEPPPPATTIAQQAPPVTTPPADTTATPPLDTTADAGTGDDFTLPRGGGAAARGGGNASTGGGSSSSGGGTSSPPPSTDTPPDLSDDIDTSTPNPPPPSDDAGDVDNGSAQDDTSGDRDRPTRRAPPRLVETNIALGAVAVPYAPYATGDEDLGDAGAIVDGSASTSWQTPAFDDPAANPQMGVYVDLASAEAITKMVLTTPTPGMSFEVYTATSGPPKSITAAGWSHLATKTDSPGKTTIQFPDGTRARYVLIWITGLPQGIDHAAISELQILSKQPA
jgi:hypothetical protein